MHQASTNHSNIQKQQKTEFLMLVVILSMLAAGLRFYDLGSDSLWLDEILTLKTARFGLNGGINNLDHPPLFFWLTTGILSTVGENEFVVRYLSAVAGILAIPLIAVFGKLAGWPRAGLWAAFLLTLAPFHIRYSQEARHYAWLMTFSLASYVLLYLALSRKSLRWWVYFALVTILNLYTHYGAFLVLATEIILIAIWLMPRLWHQRWRALFGPLLAGGIILLLYLPWLGRLQVALARNVGDAALRSGGNFSSLATWLQNIFFEFGFRISGLPFLSLALCLAGLIILAQRRQWQILGIVLSILVVPPILISTFQVDRYAFPKYIIYMLPAYLLAIGVTLDALISMASSRFPHRYRTVYLIGALTLAIIGALAIWPTIRKEYDYMERDWRGVVDRLGELAQEGDIFVPLTLDLDDGFNQGYVVTPFYLDRVFDQYTLLEGNNLNPAQLGELTKMGAQVWLLALDRIPPLPVTGESFVVEQFEGSVYLIYLTSRSLSPTETLTQLYGDLIPITRSPSPQCFLQQGLAALNVVSLNYQAAKEVLDSSITQCPDQAGSKEYRLELKHQMLDYFSNEGQLPLAYGLALSLLEENPKDQAALEVITETNLIQMFLDGQAEIMGDPLPEPVEVRRFTMPHNGDWGNVIFLHPPGSVSFDISMPESPTALTFRIALAPESWGWGGDGSTFVVKAQTAGGQPQTLFRQHVSNDSSDQDWHDGRVSLADYAGQSIILTLSTESGPAGDTTGDWAGWEMPRIVRMPSPR
jgi:hypothetical protein